MKEIDYAWGIKITGYSPYIMEFVFWEGVKGGEGGWRSYVCLILGRYPLVGNEA
jgi:hypothetical protein